MYMFVMLWTSTVDRLEAGLPPRKNARLRRVHTQHREIHSEAWKLYLLDGIA
jgi:hypothetical protein